ncbi:MAG: choice-of-anchor I family protein, partial [Bacteroidia bacterium]|nr:choice-of-anchor I family protein [Bacteroidia bacterium]
FIANSIANKLDIVNMANPSAPVAVASIDMTPYGAINSVAVRDGIVAAALGNANTQLNGVVAFFDVNGTFLKQVTAGALPDMITFTPDGTKVLTANEGEPSTDYTNDPEGSVSIIDISGGIAGLTQANVTTAGFTTFNAQMAALKAAGVRIFGPGATVAQDMEPEYITVSDDNTTAWITLQENNAVAVLDLNTSTITAILPLGYKDHSIAGAGLDGTNAGTAVNLATYPIKGMYLPDAIASYQAGGQTYLITANEGDARDYAALEEESSIGSGSYVLDPTAFPQGNLLKAAIGPLKTTNTLGDTDNDGDFDEIYVFGARSFTIWNATTGAQVYDSGDQLELITAQDPVYGAIFNASNTNITRKNRSDDKGPEPEGVAIGQIGANTYAFVALERIGGVMVYNVTNPAQPRFVQYLNSRSTTTATGDLGAEGVIFVSAAASPTGKPLVLLANEISSTITVLEIDAVSLTQYALQSTPLITTYGGIDIYEGGFSGLHYIPGSDLEFYVHGDRGPNAGATNNPISGGQTTLVFPDPAYAPKLHRIKAEADTIRILETTTLKRPDGTDATGLPNPPGQGGTGEIAWSDNLGTVVSPDVWGIDPEGVFKGPDGTFWICEEYGVSIWNLDATGKVINRYTPFAGTPNNLPIDSVFKKRKPNRGFEGVAFTPNGKVYAFLQSPLNNPNTTVGNATRLTRILELDPATGATRLFGYEFQPAVGGSGGIRARDWKIGDAAAINNFEFLVLEHAERGPANVKEVYKISIANATPITTDNFGGLTFEQLNDAATAAANGIQVVSKTRYLDLLANGWELIHDKPEGLTILDENTIAIVNDNDFGINSPLEDGTLVATGKTTKLYIYDTPEAIQPPLALCRPAVITATADTFCAGAATILTTAEVTGATYAWSLNGTQVALTNGSSYTATLGGAYTVTIAGLPACASTSPAYDIAVYEAPQIALTGDTLCQSQVATLDAGAGFATYAWSTGATTQSITVTASTLPVNTTSVFSVTGTTADGCVVRDTVGIFVEVCSGLEDLNSLALRAFPNPTRDQVQLTAENLTQSVIIRLISAEGRELSRTRVQADGQLDYTLSLEAYPAGMYLVEVIAGDRSGVIRLVRE